MPYSEELGTHGGISEKITGKARESREEELDPSKFVLTVSARDYAESRGRRLEEYDLMSVEMYARCGDVKDILMRKALGMGAEIVVDTRPSHLLDHQGNPYTYLIGTALIPRVRPAKADD